MSFSKEDIESVLEDINRCTPSTKIVRDRFTIKSTQINHHNGFDWHLVMNFERNADRNVDVTVYPVCIISFPGRDDCDGVFTLPDFWLSQNYEREKSVNEIIYKRIQVSRYEKNEINGFPSAYIMKFKSPGDATNFLQWRPFIRIKKGVFFNFTLFD